MTIMLHLKKHYRGIWKDIFDDMTNKCCGDCILSTNCSVLCDKFLKVQNEFHKLSIPNAKMKYNRLKEKNNNDI